MTPEQALAEALRSCPNHPYMVLPGPVEITGSFVQSAMKWFADNGWELRSTSAPKDWGGACPNCGATEHLQWTAHAVKCFMCGVITEFCPNCGVDTPGSCDTTCAQREQNQRAIYGICASYDPT